MTRKVAHTAMALPDPMMVLCGVDPERRASKELEKKISQWMKEYNKAIKILLLGVLLMRCSDVFFLVAFT